MVATPLACYRIFQMGGFPDLDLSFLFCPFSDFPDSSGIFPICAGMVRGFSRFVLFLFLSLLRAPTRNSPERVRDTIWTFPEKSGKHPGLETTRFSFSQNRKKEEMGETPTGGHLLVKNLNFSLVLWLKLAKKKKTHKNVGVFHVSKFFLLSSFCLLWP